jgi:hypothetical protein
LDKLWGVQDKKIHIIGTRHTCQIPGNDHETLFKNLIESSCDKYHFRGIGEEMNLEALKQYPNVKMTICQIIAERLNILHRYCDPDPAQRKSLGITSEQEVSLDGFFNDRSPQQIEARRSAEVGIRESYWLDQLLDMNTWPVLFVCGANHVETFPQILDDQKIAYEIIFRDWPDQLSNDNLTLS